MCVVSASAWLQPDRSVYHHLPSAISHQLHQTIRLAISHPLGPGANVRYLRMLSNSVAAAVLATAYVVTLVLQLNPTLSLHPARLVPMATTVDLFYALHLTVIFSRPGGDSPDRVDDRPVPEPGHDRSLLSSLCRPCGIRRPDGRRAPAIRGVLELHYALIDEAIGRSIASLGPDDLLLVVSGSGIEPMGVLKRLLERVRRRSGAERQRCSIFWGCRLGATWTATRGPTFPAALHGRATHHRDPVVRKVSE